MADFEVSIKSNVYPEYTEKIMGALDFRLAIAKVMTGWNEFCQRMRKDGDPEVSVVNIRATADWLK
jgi:hypothetical protein